jgi:hypothetical protein
MNICLIYLGNKLPAYFRANIAYLNRTFPKEHIWLITDNKENLDIATDLGIRTWLCSNPLLSWEALRNSELDLGFRNGFYSYALGRFFVLNAFMQKHPSQSVLQIEGDVWLAPNFPFSEISQITQEVAFPLERKDVVIPSTVFVKNFKASSNLLEFLTTSLASGATPIDMFLLSKYAIHFPQRVQILPSAFTNLVGFNQGTDKYTKVQISKNNYIYNGIFDSSTWGQYLFGIDPRNYLGVLILFHNQKGHAVNPSKYYFSLLDSGSIEISLGAKRTFLYSLHIHSKDVRIFLPGASQFIEERILESHKKKKVYEFHLSDIFRFFSIKKSFSFLKLFWNVKMRKPTTP